MAVEIHVVIRAGRTPGLGRAALRELLAKPVLYLLTVGPLLALAVYVYITLVFGGSLWRDTPLVLQWLGPPAAAAFPALGLAGFLSMTWDPGKTRLAR